MPYKKVTNKIIVFEKLGFSNNKYETFHMEMQEFQ